MAQCTFRPQVSPRSTAIAYNKVSERHFGQRDFLSTYMEHGTEMIDRPADDSSQHINIKQDMSDLSPSEKEQMINLTD